MEHDEEAFGAMIALFLAGSNFTEEQKDAWATVIPYMDIESMERLATFLALKMNETLDAELAEPMAEIKAIVKRNNEDRAKIDADFQAGLGALEKELV